MKKFTLLIKTLVLSALLATSALAGGERVNINTADAATLDRVLVNVGPSKAEAIVAHRKANGAFRSADQLAWPSAINRFKETDRHASPTGASSPSSRPAR